MNNLLLITILLSYEIIKCLAEGIAIESCIAVTELNAKYINCEAIVRKVWQMEATDISEDVIEYDISDDNYERRLCCGTWDIRDCLLDVSKDVCTEGEHKRVKKLVTVRIKQFELNCTNYPYHSWSCHFPFWLSSVIVVACVLVVSCSAYIFIKFCYKD